VVIIILNKRPSNYVLIHVINNDFIGGDTFVFTDLGIHCCCQFSSRVVTPRGYGQCFQGRNVPDG
jgi:hypothetical protein